VEETGFKTTVQAILQLGYAAFDKTHRLPEHLRDAAWSLMHCRTAVLGGHVQSCPEGHFQRVWYNSCRHRFCPQCAQVQVEEWLRKQKARLLDCDHYHVIFTLPEELRLLWRSNTRLMTELLFKTVRDTLFELLEDEKHLGAKPGMMASLQTWSKTLVLHPHVHCLVTGGGLSRSADWVRLKKDYLLAFRVVRDLFRGKMCAALLQALEQERIVLPEAMRVQGLRNLLNQLGRKKWNVKICEKYSHGNGVLIYLGRYLRGGPISNRRIVEVTGETVTFSCGRDKAETMRLSISEFMGRLLQHVALPHAVVVRSYGIYARTSKAELAKCRQILGQGPIEKVEKLVWQSSFEGSQDHPEVCPVCGKRLVRTHTVTPLKPPASFRERRPQEVYGGKAA